MDTFDTSEEVMSETDVEETEVDFGENFEHGTNDQEHENINEQEAELGGEKGGKSIEDEKLEDKEQTLSEFITASRCAGGEEFKLEYEGNFILSTLTEEQKLTQADLLTTLTANPEQPIMLPDYIEGKTTFFTAAKMDNEGNLKYEIRSFTNKEEEKEEKPIDNIEGSKPEEATLNLELSIDIDKQEEVGKGEVIEESTMSHTGLAEVVVDRADKMMTLEDRVRELLGYEPEPAEARPEQVVDSAEVSQTVAIEPELHELVVNEKADTEKEALEVVNKQVEQIQEQAPIVQEVVVMTEVDSKEVVKGKEIVVPLTEVAEVYKAATETQIYEPVVAKTPEASAEVTAIPTENIAEIEIISPSTYTEVNELSVNETSNTTTERSVISNEQIEQIVVNAKRVEKQTEINETIQVSRVESVQEQSTEQVVENTERSSTREQVIEKVQSHDVVIEAVANIPKEISRTEIILSEVINEVPVAKGKEAKSENKEVQEVIIKSEEKIVVEIKGREINSKTEKTDNIKSKKITTERTTTERRIQDREEKPEAVILTTDKDIKVANTRESKVVAKEATPEKAQILNTKPKKEAKDNVLPFKTRESRPNLRDVEIKTTKLIVEKTTREAIVLKFNSNTANNTTRSEVPISLEKPKEEQRAREESIKAKPLSGHEILLQILGISQNGAEVRNAEPANSRSVSNTNQEEQETKSAKSVPSMYQQKNLNGITLKIAA